MTEPARQLRDNQFHSFNQQIPWVAQPFHKPRIVESLFIQQ